MFRHLVALLLAALLLASHVAALDCAGWGSSPSDRMACCVKAEHECSDQMAADQCCAAGELAQQATLSPSIAVLSLPAVSIAPLPVLFVAHSIVPVFRSLSDHPQSPPHFRRTALLI